MVRPAYGADLRHERLLNLLVHGHLQDLHGHRQAVRQLTLVDHAVASGPQLRRVVPGAGRQLLGAETHRLLVEDLVEEHLNWPDLDHHIFHGAAGLHLTLTVLFLNFFQDFLYDFLLHLLVLVDCVY